MTDQPRGAHPPTGDDALRRLLSGELEPSRLSEALAAMAAPPAPGPQPGEAEALAAFRELVAAPAGVVSLASHRRLRAVALASSVLVVMGGGVAAAAAGALPGPAQSVAKNVLGVVGLHVPTPHPTPSPHPTPHPAPTSTEPGGDTGTPHGVAPSAPVSPHPTAAGRGSASPHPTHPAHPAHPAHPSTPPTPGNSGSSRHHGNPTPSATAHPSPGHGKPTAPPATSHRKSPHTPKTASAVTHGNRAAIHP